MATIDFPSELNKAQQTAFTRSFVEGFISSQPASGPAFHIVETEDKPAVFNVEFVFSLSESVQFKLWLEQSGDVLYGELFNIVVYGEGQALNQEARFSQEGTPQLTSVGAGFKVYRATIECPNYIEDGIGNEDTLLVGFW